jgi:hypothetical protein
MIAAAFPVELSGPATPIKAAWADVESAATKNAPVAAASNLLIITSSVILKLFQQESGQNDIVLFFQIVRRSGR